MTWARHYLEEWQRRAGDPRLPHWLRVAAAAYGLHQENGHAPFKSGQLALILGSPGKPYKNVTRAIEDAVEYGWLGEGSFHRCLIVPMDVARKGSLTAKPAPCGFHTQRGIRPLPTDTQRGIRADIPHSPWSLSVAASVCSVPQPPTQGEPTQQQEPA